MGKVKTRKYQLKFEKLNEEIEEIEKRGAFVVPFCKPNALDKVLKCKFSGQQKAVYTLIVRLEAEQDQLNRLLSLRSISDYEYLLSSSILSIELEALRSTLWLSLLPYFESSLKSGANYLGIKKDFSLCLSHSFNECAGERKAIYLRPPD